jgi:gliding motility-associated lipoprotein GldD
MRKIFFSSLVACMIFAACSDGNIYTPKPRSYPKINYPDRAFTDFNAPYCNFSFRMPEYFEIQQDTSYFDRKPENDCWFNLYLKEFDATLYCNYVEVGKSKTFDELKNDAFKITDFHNKRATYIDEILLKNQFGMKGIAFEVEGPVASHYQFFLTDEKQDHFFRGSLYFQSQSKPDSLKPMLDFVKQDLDSLIYTFKWD